MWEKKIQPFCLHKTKRKSGLFQEAYIADLDAKSGASLKLTILNPRGRIWTMVAGGGASVIYAWVIDSTVVVPRVGGKNNVEQTCETQNILQGYHLRHGWNQWAFKLRWIFRSSQWGTNVRVREDNSLSHDQGNASRWWAKVSGRYFDVLYPGLRLFRSASASSFVFLQGKF